MVAGDVVCSPEGRRRNQQALWEDVRVGRLPEDTAMKGQRLLQ